MRGSKGCARGMVVQGLQDSTHEFKLLIRYPESLDYTEEQKSKLTIIQGDAAENLEKVKETIANTDVIVYSIGSGFNMGSRTMTHPGICKKTIAIVFKALEELPENERPKRLVVVSSAGVDGTSDVPFLLRPLYYYLHAPHVDKKDLETLVEENKLISDYIIVRPSILTDGKLTGKYRADENISGYTISREDVGHFLLHQCLEPTTWIKKKVLVTY
ncbi:unnamed protein product [Mucor hiemalis]